MIVIEEGTTDRHSRNEIHLSTTVLVQVNSLEGVFSPKKTRDTGTMATQIPGSYTFDIARARRGYAFNKMAYSLQQPANREVYVKDERSYMESYGLPEVQIKAVLDRDWLKLIKEGANSYMLMKLGATIGVGHYHQGAQERGETYEEFLATRNVPGAT